MDNLFAGILKDIDNKCLNDDLKDMAEALRALYLNFKNAGFTPNQSLDLTKEILRISCSIAKGRR